MATDGHRDIGEGKPTAKTPQTSAASSVMWHGQRPLGAGTAQKSWLPSCSPLGQLSLLRDGFRVGARQHWLARACPGQDLRRKPVPPSPAWPVAAGAQAAGERGLQSPRASEALGTAARPHGATRRSRGLAGSSRGRFLARGWGQPRSRQTTALFLQQQGWRNSGARCWDWPGLTGQVLPRAAPGTFRAPLGHSGIVGWEASYETSL